KSRSVGGGVGVGGGPGVGVAVGCGGRAGGVRTIRWLRAVGVARAAAPIRVGEPPGRAARASSTTTPAGASSQPTARNTVRHATRRGARDESLIVPRAPTSPAREAGGRAGTQ